VVELPNYVQVPHEVFRHLKILTGNEVKVLLSICRKTFGYHKLTDDISYSQIEEMCGVSRANASRAVKRLCELDLVEKSTKKGKTTRYDMKVMCAKTTQEDLGTVVKTTTLTVAKTTHTKERRKETRDTTKVVSRDRAIYHLIKKAFVSKNQDFDYKRECPHIAKLEVKALSRPDPEAFIKKAIVQFWSLTHSKDKLFGHQPFLPSVMDSGGMWPRLLKIMEDEQIKGRWGSVDELVEEIEK